MLPSLYVHIPFCDSKCSYCSFSVAAGQLAREMEYLDQLEREAEKYRGHAVGSVYLGGGTPSSLTLKGVRRLLGFIRGSFSFPVEAEVTLEANPESVDSERAAAWRELGVNRVSLGAQTFDDFCLQWLGRRHSGDEALKAFLLLRAAGFKNINVDMMFGFFGQAVSALDADLDRFLALGSEHLSLYALNVEERSAFFVRKEKIDHAAQAQACEHAWTRLERRGIQQYEVSNFARAGYESAHNLHYWRGGEYIGLGMAAHSHIQGRRFWNADTLPLYLKMMAETGSAETGSETLAAADKLMEVFLFGLRMNSGVDVAALQDEMKTYFLESSLEAMESFIELGLLEDDKGWIKATSRGRMVLDEISARLV